MIVLSVPSFQRYYNTTEIVQLIHYITNMRHHNDIYIKEASPFLLFIWKIHYHKLQI